MVGLSVPGSAGMTCSQIFEEAWGNTPASPGCGGCSGGPEDRHGRMNEPQASYFISFYLLSLTQCCFQPGFLCYFMCLVDLPKHQSLHGNIFVDRSGNGFWILVFPHSPTLEKWLSLQVLCLDNKPELPKTSGIQEDQ